MYTNKQKVPAKKYAIAKEFLRPKNFILTIIDAITRVGSSPKTLSVITLRSISINKNNIYPNFHPNLNASLEVLGVEEM